MQYLKSKLKPKKHMATRKALRIFPKFEMYNLEI